MVPPVPTTTWKPGLTPTSPTTVTARIDANINAIEIVKNLDGHAPTQQQQALLAKYSGWGGLSAVFDERNQTHNARRTRLKSLLSEDEYSAARRSVLNAHYTHPAYANAIWQSLTNYGFNSGSVLEPGCGVGTFIGQAPQGAQMTGVEIDPLSASIAQALYPNATIRNEGYESTPTPELFDAAVGNVPFGDINLYDPAGNPGNHSIHNHFIIKALSQTKPGAVVAVITSRYTLDAANPAARRDMYEKADLLSAVRLPTGAHSEVANTEALTDVLVFRVRKDSETALPFMWEHSTAVDINGESVRINTFFQDHPTSVLGEFRVGQGMYNAKTLHVDPTSETAKNPVRIAELLSERVSADLGQARKNGLTYSPEHAPEHLPVANAPATRTLGSIRSSETGFETLTHTGWEPLKVPKTQAGELTALLEIRDSVRALIEAEAASATDTPQLAHLRDQLKTRYSSYFDKYGALNRAQRKTYLNSKGKEVYRERRPPVMRIFEKDPFAPLAKAVEVYDADAQTAQPAPIQRGRQIFAKYTPKGADTPTDAMYICLEQKGKIDLDYIAYLLGETDIKTVREQLGTEIFDLPGGQYATRAQYLSGNVRSKPQTAMNLSEADSRYQVNVDALKEVIPADLTPMDISVEPGAAWISPKLHTQFIRQLVRQSDIVMGHDPINGWGMKGTYTHGVLQTATWGTPRMSATQIFLNLCNNAPIRVFDADSETKTEHLNPVATEAAQGKAEQIRDEFVKWVWDDPNRAEELLKLYNQRFNSHVQRSYETEGQALRLPGLAKTFTLHDHQKTAVARMIAEPTTGLFHEVGAGKTLEMVAGVMEQKRLGLIQKPMIVVPNHMLAQFEREWLQAYPQAKILAADKDDITNKSGRGDFMARVTTSNWDAVICTQSAFRKIPVDAGTLETYMGKEIENLENWLASSKDAERYSVSRAEKTLIRMKTQLEQRLAKLKDSADTGLTFDKLGVDYLVVDEAHHYKNLSARTRTQGIISSSAADRAQDLDMKLSYLRQTYGARCATFATATPVANTMGEMWVMTHYLRPDLLEESGLDTFDQWAKTFTEITSSVEATAAGTLEVRQRPARFKNLPELMQMWSTFADVKTRDQLNLKTPDIAVNHDGNRSPEIVSVEAGSGIDQFQERILKRAELIQSRQIEPHIDNWLTLSNDGKAMATDYRLIPEKSRERALEGVDLPLEQQKVDVAADRISDIYQQTKDNTYLDELGQVSDTRGALQIVFVDQGTPTSKNAHEWNLYDELKMKLVERGVPADKIVYTHDASTTVEKDRIFAKARTGAISVLIGSTEKMGTGANMQSRAVALHHLTAPWRPADLAQREGRIIRQGNQNGEIQILRYVTERSFDTYMWQTLERKANFINQIMCGDYSGREAEDLSDDAASYAQVKAIASGNPLLIEEAQIQNELRTYTRRSQAWRSNRNLLQSQVVQAKTAIRTLVEKRKHLEALAQTVVSTKGANFTASINGQTYTSRIDFANALKAALRPDYATATGRCKNLYESLYSYKGISLIPKVTIGNTPLLVGLEPAKHLNGEPGFAFAFPRHNFPHIPTSDVAHVAITLKDIEDAKVSVVTRLENRVQSLGTEISHINERIDNYTTESERAKAELALDDPWAEKLRDTKEQLQTIRSKIAAWEIDKASEPPAHVPPHAARLGDLTTNFGAPLKSAAATPTVAKLNGATNGRTAQL
ncbi:MAG: DEAD/DEAH box helicase family protein [Actinomycetaceae bacterium]|nr:DEAD/DEAH box helicase family protein [Actinomycetaceae bacterium]